jgi:hypothetical protein
VIKRLAVQREPGPRTPDFGHATPALTQLHTMPLHEIPKPHAYSHSISFQPVLHHMSGLGFLLARHPSYPQSIPTTTLLLFFTREVPSRNANTTSPPTQREIFFFVLLYTVLQCSRDRRRRRSSQMKGKAISMHRSVKTRRVSRERGVCRSRIGLTQWHDIRETSR